MSKEEFRKELNLISIYNTLGLLGVLFPILAWVFAGIGFSKARNLLSTYDDTGDDEKDDANRSLVRDKSINSIIIILLSIASAIGWYLAFGGR